MSIKFLIGFDDVLHKMALPIIGANKISVMNDIIFDLIIEIF